MKVRPKSRFGASVLLLAVAAPALAVEDPMVDVEAYNECLLEKLRSASAETTAGDIRQACLLASQGATTDESESADMTAGEEAASSPLDSRIEETEATEEMRYVITPFKLNSIMVGSAALVPSRDPGSS